LRTRTARFGASVALEGGCVPSCGDDSDLEAFAHWLQTPQGGELIASGSPDDEDDALEHYLSDKYPRQEEKGMREEDDDIEYCFYEKCRHGCYRQFWYYTGEGTIAPLFHARPAPSRGREEKLASLVTRGSVGNLPVNFVAAVRSDGKTPMIPSLQQRRGEPSYFVVQERALGVFVLILRRETLRMGNIPFSLKSIARGEVLTGLRMI